MRAFGSTAFRPRLSAALCLAAICGLASAVEPGTSTGFFATQDLFVVGSDPTYSRYHIPGIVVTAKGSVLAWWDIRILLHRRPAHARPLSPRLGAGALTRHHRPGKT